MLFYFQLGASFSCSGGVCFSGVTEDHEETPEEDDNKLGYKHAYFNSAYVDHLLFTSEIYLGKRSIEDSLNFIYNKECK
jgi:hypothetical protein